MIKSLRKVDFSHPTGHYTRKKVSPPPLQKILGAPLRVHIPLQINARGIMQLLGLWVLFSQTPNIPAYFSIHSKCKSQCFRNPTLMSVKTVSIYLIFGLARDRSLHVL